MLTNNRIHLIYVCKNYAVLVKRPLLSLCLLRGNPNSSQARLQKLFKNCRSISTPGFAIKDHLKRFGNVDKQGVCALYQLSPSALE